MDKLTDYSTDYIVITEDHDLNQYCDSWKNKPYLALDTEFMRTDSFYPKVALLQVSDGERNFLIDPLSIADWEQFIALMLAPEITKIFHSCSEDLLVFIRQFGLLPSPVFDTQVANAFLNQGFGLSYQNMVSEQLGIDVPKGETRSNWLQRPLSAQQLDYAALDVAYLPEIYLRQKEALAAMNKLVWVEEDCQRLGNNYKEELAQDFSQTYRNISAAWQLDEEQLVILKVLAEWREKRARHRDKPRNWIIKDKELVTIAKSIPENIEQLSQIEGLNTNFIHYEGRALITLIQDNLNIDAEKLPEALPRPLSNGQKKIFKKAQLLVEKKAGELNLPIEVLGRKRTLISVFQEILKLKSSATEELIDVDKMNLPDELLGWRKEILVEGLLEVLQ
ncbi:MAG: ribonuclease D [SAR86 cluster bacterium]|uniref:Ribonuclease D n=1 Tax=SAR86 cluster bacterium TaxID=2030880 RepID=A0A2A5C7U5_9GAMM|nr:MAG: ribonuclease D [SAR86 cluster bacterium]